MSALDFLRALMLALLPPPEDDPQPICRTLPAVEEHDPDALKPQRVSFTQFTCSDTDLNPPEAS